MNPPSPSPSSLFHASRVVVGKEVPDRSKLARLLSENGAFCISGSALIADLKFPTPLPYGDVYFLLDSFTGETFEDLKRKGAKIIGPQVVYDSLRLQKPLPVASHPVFCRTLDGMHITSTGFQPRKKAEIEVLVQYMNGSEKYHVATQRQIPVVCYDWIVQAWKSQTQPPAKNFALPPLSGLVICVTGLRPDTRLTVRKLVSANGGRYSADLTRHCTHLLAENTSGDKFRYAAVWRIPTVTTDWLFDCVNQQAYQDVSRYLVCPNFAASAGRPDTDFCSSPSVINSSTALLSSLVLPTPIPFVPLSPSPSESLIVHTTPSGQRRKTAIHRQNMQSATPLQPSASSPSPLTTSSDFASPSSSLSAVPCSSSSATVSVMAQLKTLYRAVNDTCRRLRENSQEESLPRELARLVGLIETVTSSLLTPHTAAALLLTADSGTTPMFRDACLRYIAEHYFEVRASAAFHSLPVQLQYEVEHSVSSASSVSAASATAVSASGGGVASASSSSLPEMSSPSSGERGSRGGGGGSERPEDATGAGKRRRIS